MHPFSLACPALIALRGVQCSSRYSLLPTATARGSLKLTQYISFCGATDRTQWKTVSSPTPAPSFSSTRCLYVLQQPRSSTNVAETKSHLAYIHRGLCWLQLARKAVAVDHGHVLLVVKPA